MVDNEKIAMIVGASSALSYRRKNPSADSEEILKYVIKTIEVNKKAKVFGVAAANFVMKYISQNSQATEREVMQNLTNEIPKILNFIKSEDIA